MKTIQIPKIGEELTLADDWTFYVTLMYQNYQFLLNSHPSFGKDFPNDTFLGYQSAQEYVKLNGDAISEIYKEEGIDFKFDKNQSIAYISVTLPKGDVVKFVGIDAGVGKDRNSIRYLLFEHQHGTFRTSLKESKKLKWN